jgi:DNA-binding CsgD family transcriptional regulator
MNIVEQYESGKSATKISKETGISLHKVLKQLKHEGVKVYNKQNEIKWDVNEFVSLYNKGYSLVEIGKQFNLSTATISNALKKINFKVVNKQNITKFNENVFDVIDTEEKAYWLGFIYADGYVSSSRNTFELSLALKDINHLIKFAKFMSYEKNVKNDDYRCRFYVVNKHFKQTLINLGVIPNKSLILTFPNSSQIPHNLVNHFIRGYYDGDGTILTKETSKVKLRVSLLGTESFLNSVLNTIEIDKKLYQTTSNVKYFSLEIKDSEKFLKFLYKDTTVYLDRKYDLYKKYCRSSQK